MLIFSGYYGVWLAIGIPIALDVESSEGFAAFLVTVPAACIFVAHEVTKNRSVTEADAEMVSLGGWFGTWQGVGWTAIADKRTEGVVGAGVLGGLAGVGLACALNKATELSEGHATLMNSANWWGTWLGLLVAAGSEADGDDVLASALIGSSFAVGLTGMAAGNTTLTERRVRYMNMGGILGGIFGGGVILLAGIEDNGRDAAVLGVSSIAGGYLGVRVSRPRDNKQSRWNGAIDGSLALDNAPTLHPIVGWSRQNSETRIGLEVRF